MADFLLYNYTRYGLRVFYNTMVLYHKYNTAIIHPHLFSWLVCEVALASICKPRVYFNTTTIQYKKHTHCIEPKAFVAPTNPPALNLLGSSTLE